MAGKPLPIAGILSDLLARKGYARVQAERDFQSAWLEAAGPLLGKHSRAVAVRQGVLEVLVASSTMMQEINFQKAALIRRMTELAPEQTIRELRLRVGSLK